MADFNTYNYTPNHHLPYPNRDQENVDLIENLEKLANAIEDSLDEVDTDLGDKQDKSNLVTSLDSSSTDIQYPSAKCVYDILGNIAALLDQLNGEVV